MTTSRRTTQAKRSAPPAKKTAAPAPAETKSRRFRITNVRANAAGVGASASLVPTQIVALRARKK
jgi:hypothetical protein